VGVALMMVFWNLKHHVGWCAHCDFWEECAVSIFSIHWNQIHSPGI